MTVGGGAGANELVTLQRRRYNAFVLSPQNFAKAAKADLGARPVAGKGNEVLDRIPDLDHTLGYEFDASRAEVQGFAGFAEDGRARPYQFERQLQLKPLVLPLFSHKSLIGTASCKPFKTVSPAMYKVKGGPS